MKNINFSNGKTKNIKTKKLNYFLQCFTAIYSIVMFNKNISFSCLWCLNVILCFGQVRVGVIQFGSTPKLEISLDSYNSKEELKKKMKKIHYRYRDYCYCVSVRLLHFLWKMRNTSLHFISSRLCQHRPGGLLFTLHSQHVCASVSECAVAW